jgi:nitroreductase
VTAADSEEIEEGFFRLVSTQRACRAFTDQTVDSTDLERILQAATFAPSAENRQPWVFVVVEDPDRRAAFGQLIQEIWESFGRAYSQKHATPHLLRDVEHGLGEGGVAGAPVLIVVGGDTSLVDRSQIKASVFPAIQNLMLGAAALGLGSCLTTIATLQAEKTRELVDFPPEIEPVALLPIGYPRRKLGPPNRQSFTAKAHRERFGSGWTE